MWMTECLIKKHFTYQYRNVLYQNDGWTTVLWESFCMRSVFLNVNIDFIGCLYNWAGLIKTIRARAHHSPATHLILHRINAQLHTIQLNINYAILISMLNCNVNGSCTKWYHTKWCECRMDTTIYKTLFHMKCEYTLYGSQRMGLVPFEKDFLKGDL